VSLSSLEGAETLEELDLEGETVSRPAVQPRSFEPLAGESYPVSEADRRKEPLERRKPRVLALIGFILLGLIVLAGAAYLAYQLLDGERIPRLFGGSRTPVEQVEQPARAPEPEKPAPKAPEEPAPKAPAAQKTEPAVQKVEPAAQAAEGIWYRIVWGDTLWDLAGTYYRNPWLYPRLAKANKIANPDLIIAGHRLFIPKK
jgi:hypothetical protein